MGLRKIDTETRYVGLSRGARAQYVQQVKIQRDFIGSAGKYLVLSTLRARVLLASKSEKVYVLPLK